MRREERQEIEQIRDSLKVSSYFDQVLESISTNKPVPKGIVPDFREHINGAAISTLNESNSLYTISADHLLQQTALGAADPELLANLPSETEYKSNDSTTKFSETDSDRPRILLSNNQAIAIKRYPALIELLGTEAGDALVHKFLAEVNQILINKIAQNTKEISDSQGYKSVSRAEKHNIKQYFVAPDESWACCITASGPFRGDEAIYYKRESDQAYVLRKIAGDYEDISSEFDIICESAEAGE